MPDNFCLPAKSFVTDLTQQLREFIPSKTDRPLERHAVVYIDDEANDKSNKNSIQDHLPEVIDDDDSESLDYQYVNASQAPVEQRKKTYMFGKMSGSRWVTKKFASNSRNKSAFKKLSVKNLILTFIYLAINEINNTSSSDGNYLNLLFFNTK